MRSRSGIFIIDPPCSMLASPDLPRCKIRASQQPVLLVRDQRRCQVRATAAIISRKQAWLKETMRRDACYGRARPICAPATSRGAGTIAAASHSVLGGYASVSAERLRWLTIRVASCALHAHLGGVNITGRDRPGWGIQVRTSQSGTATIATRREAGWPLNSNIAIPEC